MHGGEAHADKCMYYCTVYLEFMVIQHIDSVCTLPDTHALPSVTLDSTNFTSAMIFLPNIFCRILDKVIWYSVKKSCRHNSNWRSLCRVFSPTLGKGASFAKCLLYLSSLTLGKNWIPVVAVHVLKYSPRVLNECICIFTWLFFLLSEW